MRAAVCRSTAHTPKYGRMTLPFLIIESIIGFAELIGMAKPIPSTPSLEILELLMPINSPSAFSNAPPEFPGLMAASV